MASTLGTIGTGSIDFQGVSLHYPAQADATERLFQYGTIDKGSEIAMDATPMRFVGRTSRVYDFSTMTDENYSFKIEVPFGDTYYEELAWLRSVGTTREVLCVRDGRGRVVYGVVSSWSDSDSMVGTTVSMTISNTDFVEGL